ncbi:MAG: AbrB/MazE/SpoVT family DNA-binding domain-containing protein [Anaerolineae bacterium]|nr:AbrB/MazE/SpoVT family DNA-binding domain-containing protein [Anaerolineae bacterium]
MTRVTKVGRRGQMVVPASVRRLLNLREGDHVAFVRRGDEIILQPLSASLLDLRGSVPVSGPQDFEAIRRKVIGEQARKGASGDS